VYLIAPSRPHDLADCGKEIDLLVESVRDNQENDTFLPVWAFFAFRLTSMARTPKRRI
jgi:hypothetical protein